MFLLRKWVEKLVKAILAACAAYFLGPKVQPILQPLFDAAGWALTPESLQAALWVVWVSATNWIKHQPKTPGWLKKVL